ncbi:hypothetical protein AB1Y20_021077 [Prymnesium parvum]|uniref:SET domain-containing protein n=1 Tax=Prymnesium parvum TaxID=97485 RepID=A0AB34JKB1_PRYPA
MAEDELPAELLLHVQGLRAEALALREVPTLGSTLVARRPLPAGALLFREAPLLSASPLRAIAPPLRATYQQGAAQLGLHLDDLLVAHAAARAAASVRAAALAAFCSVEACGASHPLARSAALTAEWCVAHDAEWARVGMAREQLERLLVACALNAFGYLADGRTGGATSLYLLGSKFTHRCIDPAAVFHGQEGMLAFRTIRPVEEGEVLTISYLGPWGRASAPARRRLLYESKGFACLCADCLAADRLRLLPCPSCAPRDEHGLLTAPAHAHVVRVPLSHDPATVEIAAEAEGKGEGKGMGEAEAEGKGMAEAEAEAEGKGEGKGMAEAEAEAEGGGALAAVGRPPRGVRGIWRCEACATHFEDRELDVACTPPEGAWPLSLPPGGLLAWEAALEEAAHNLMTALLSSEEAPPHPSLRRMAALLAAVRRVVGGVHWVTVALVELQLDHWLELAVAHAPGERREAEAALLGRMRGEAAVDFDRWARRPSLRASHVLHGSPRLGYARSLPHLFDSIWQSTMVVVQHQRAVGTELWATLPELILALQAWGDAYTRDFLAAPAWPAEDEAMRSVPGDLRFPLCIGRSFQDGSTRGEVLSALLEDTLQQTRIEYGSDSDDAADIAKLYDWIVGLIGN